MEQKNVKDIKIEDLQREIGVLRNRIEQLHRENNSFLYAALCKSQMEMPLVKRNAVSFGNQKYASYADSINVSRGILTKNGLSVIQYVSTEGERQSLRTRLCHEEGQYIESVSLLVLGNTANVKTGDLQKEIGAAQTYTFRRDYNSIIGLVREDDE